MTDPLPVGYRPTPGPDPAQHARRMMVAGCVILLLWMFTVQHLVPPPQRNGQSGASSATPTATSSEQPVEPKPGDPPPKPGDPSPKPGDPPPKPAPKPALRSGVEVLDPAKLGEKVVLSDAKRGLEVVVHSLGAVVSQLRLTNFNSYGKVGSTAKEDQLELLPVGGAFRLVVNNATAPLPDNGQQLWQVSARADDSVTLRLKYSNGLTLIKRFSLDPKGGVRCNLEVQNTGDAPFSARWGMIGIPSLYRESEISADMRAMLFPGDKSKEDYREPVYTYLSTLTAGMNDRDFKAPMISGRTLVAAAVAGKYFGAVWHFDTLPGASIVDARGVFAPPMPHLYDADKDKSIRVSLQTEDIEEVAPGGKLRIDTRLEVGSNEELEQRPYDGMLVNYGWTGSVSRLMMWLLKLVYGFTGNYGWALVLLTIAIKIVLHPLTRRSQISMHRFQEQMKKWKPEMDAINEKYAKDPQRKQEELLKLYRKHNINPFPVGGCLPMLMQMPIFLGFYFGLSYSILLRQQPWLWVTDLALPDRLVEWSKPFLWHFKHFNLLPIIMTVVWFLQQKMMPKPAAMDENMEAQQKMMQFMPLMFGVMLYNFAAGLCLYWFTSNLVGIVEQKFIKAEIARLKEADEAAADEAPAGGKHGKQGKKGKQG